ncbi:hypothetical protein M758_UG273800 [Ceratodon purpureus]|nr:hypothetical protein M758_UG273800 [Ceratodon purpureus]
MYFEESTTAVNQSSPDTLSMKVTYNKVGGLEEILLATGGEKVQGGAGWSWTHGNTGSKKKSGGHSGVWAVLIVLLFVAAGASSHIGESCRHIGNLHKETCRNEKSRAAIESRQTKTHMKIKKLDAGRFGALESFPLAFFACFLAPLPFDSLLRHAPFLHIQYHAEADHNLPISTAYAS